MKILLPPRLQSAIGSETIDFAVKARRSSPTKMSLVILLFGFIWTVFSSIFALVFIGPVIMGQEVHFESNGVPTVAGPDNLGPLIVPGLIIGLFLFIGVLILAAGIVSLFKRGGYFAGTPTRLIHFYGRTTRSIDWEQFSGDIEVKGTERKGSIALKMRSGKTVSSKNGPDRYVPDVIYISGIPDVFDVERFCRRRIKENDPTPPISIEL